MARNPIYRAVIRVPGPRVLIGVAGRAHRMFQRGTLLETTFREGRADAVLMFPPRLHVGLNLVSNVSLLRAVVELTGGNNVRARMTSVTDIEARYTVDWD
jgi:hypothetical protein